MRDALKALFDAVYETHSEYHDEAYENEGKPAMERMGLCENDICKAAGALARAALLAGLTDEPSR